MCICQSYNAQGNLVKAGTFYFLMIFQSGTSELKKPKVLKRKYGVFLSVVDIITSKWKYKQKGFLCYMLSINKSKINTFFKIAKLRI